MTMSDFSGYKVGGTVDPARHTYIVRSTDDEFFEALLKGEYCYVLNARQMGKSSLRVHASRRLQRSGVACVDIDLTGIGSRGVTPDQWYGSLARAFIDACELDLDWRAWVGEREHLTPVARFGEFIEKVLLVQVQSPVVVFLDEIDCTLHLPFKDDFFAFIRNCHNRKAEKTGYDRLAFALLGVASPSDLIADPTSTPFNVGRAFELAGFTLQEALPLAEGLRSVAQNPGKALGCILEWTGGQPFLTQKLCSLLAQSGTTVPSGGEAVCVERLVREGVLEDWESQDVPQHLRTIRDRLLMDVDRAGRLLGLYQRVLEEGSVLAAGRDEQTLLKLTGLTVGKGGRLVVACGIYARVFDGEWIAQTLAGLRPYNDSLTRWEKSNRQDASHLLGGEDLREAQRWASDKSLGDLDYQFLSASQQLENKLVQTELELEKKERQLEQVGSELALTKQKAQGERSRNRVAMGAAALLVVVLAGGIGATTWQAQIAKRRFDDVRALANSFMFEFHDAIEKLPGSTPARRLVVEKALGYLDSLSAEASGDASLQLELAAAYQKTGDIQWNRYYANLGDTLGALKSHSKARAIRQSLAAQRPEDLQIARALATSHVLTGDVLVETGDLRAALASYRKSLDMRRELLAKLPTDSKLRKGVAISHQRMGDTLGNPNYSSLGRTAEAVSHYGQMQQIFEELSAAQPDDIDARLSVSHGHEKIGDVLGAGGDNPGAFEAYRRALEIRSELSAKAPADAHIRRDLAVGLNRFGRVLATRGDSAGALKNHRQALAIYRALAAADPANEHIRLDMAYGLVQLGRALAATGAVEAALASNREALQIDRSLSEADPANNDARHELSIAHRAVAEALTKLGDLPGSMQHYDKAQAIREGLSAKNPSDTRFLRSLAESRSDLGRVHELAAVGTESLDSGRLHRWQMAQLWYQRSMDAWRSLAARSTLNPADAAGMDEVARAISRCTAAIGSSSSSSQSPLTRPKSRSAQA
ncbi:MAG: AAA-like domain-containing protein [Aphanocapsa lilacina HA4352-LM1]|jgi:tetratricopeptide (TPR) repeat protein|nr:AAA-like domain-containing protein [Aphanocapsa lilacina HA4352-LM1]